MGFADVYYIIFEVFNDAKWLDVNYKLIENDVEVTVFLI